MYRRAWCGVSLNCRDNTVSRAKSTKRVWRQRVPEGLRRLATLAYTVKDSAGRGAPPVHPSLLSSNQCQATLSVNLPSPWPVFPTRQKKQHTHTHTNLVTSPVKNAWTARSNSSTFLSIMHVIAVIIQVFGELFLSYEQTVFIHFSRLNWSCCIFLHAFSVSSWYDYDISRLVRGAATITFILLSIAEFVKISKNAHFCRISKIEEQRIKNRRFKSLGVKGPTWLQYLCMHTFVSKTK